VVHGVQLFVLLIDVQAVLEQAVAVVVVATAAAMVGNGAKFSQYNMVWGGFPRARDSRC
jgi:hypothetical protein